mmetsp:Transcript_14327/g.25616  ORF Transcript_14327/g.25616 Transcript_14327/m.25616 type:complete len:102 (-) Transcript_14327:339-644(-)
MVRLLQAKSSCGLAICVCMIWENKLIYYCWPRKKGCWSRMRFFVLMLKCVLGHSKLAYDAQVEEVVDKNGLRAPENGVEGLEIFHLFSNRSGERTVIGYIR